MAQQRAGPVGVMAQGVDVVAQRQHQFGGAMADPTAGPTRPEASVAAIRTAEEIAADQCVENRTSGPGADTGGLMRRLQRRLRLGYADARRGIAPGCTRGRKSGIGGPRKESRRANRMV